MDVYERLKLLVSISVTHLLASWPIAFPFDFLLDQKTLMRFAVVNPIAIDPKAAEAWCEGVWAWKSWSTEGS